MGGRRDAGTVAPMAKAPATEVEVGGRTVRISNPDRVYFPVTGATKLDLVEYYLGVGPGIVNALRERPCTLHVAHALAVGNAIQHYWRSSQEVLERGASLPARRDPMPSSWSRRRIGRNRRAATIRRAPL